jgi:hypothetical protein
MISGMDIRVIPSGSEFRRSFRTETGGFGNLFGGFKGVVHVQIFACSSRLLSLHHFLVRWLLWNNKLGIHATSGATE